ncbi:MAG: rod shape-determining protein MreC, partial [Lachnospiraceae bacterium]|nr:rod shape-determining protein MreC [Lachnospiraceae bacterium]
MSPVIKKKRKQFTISSKYLLLGLSVFCVLLMIFTFKTSIFEGPLKTIASYAVVPFQKGIATVGGYLFDRSEEMAQLRDVLA